MSERLALLLAALTTSAEHVTGAHPFSGTPLVARHLQRRKSGERCTFDLDCEELAIVVFVADVPTWSFAFLCYPAERVPTTAGERLPKVLQGRVLPPNRQLPESGQTCECRQRWYEAARNGAFAETDELDRPQTMSVALEVLDCGVGEAEGLLRAALRIRSKTSSGNLTYTGTPTQGVGDTLVGDPVFLRWYWYVEKVGSPQSHRTIVAAGRVYSWAGWGPARLHR